MWGARGETALRRWALAGFAVVTAISVANQFLVQGLDGRPGLTGSQTLRVDWGEAGFCVLMASSGLLVLWYRPRHSVGWLLVATGFVEALCTLGQTYGARAHAFPADGLPCGALALQLSAPLWLWAVFLPVTAVLLRYPSGHVEGRWARRVDRAVLLGLVLIYLGYASGDHSVSDVVEGGTAPLGLPGVASGTLMGVGALLLLPGTVLVVAHTVRRTWRAAYPERQQLAWLVTVAPIGAGTLFLPWEGSQKAFWAIPVAVVVGVLRYKLAGIEIVVQRTLLYGALTGLVLLVFVAVTAGLSSSLPSGALPEVLAAGLVAVGVVPLRDRLQRGVNRFVYGDRGDPLRALKRLGSPLGITSDEALLPDVLSGVATALRVPGAEVVGKGGAAAAVGLAGDRTVEVPLVMGGAEVGVLRLVPRAGETQLHSADRALLEALVPLLAAVLHAVELTAALRVEQERVVAATETERARLRQELHDGLGPSLTGIGLGLEALQAKVGGSELVDRLRAEAATSLEEVRRIIDGLRPGALESADLLSLLRLRAQHLSATTPLRVTVLAPGRLPALPPEVEGAALRIVEEALTNVVKHAGATSCVVTVALDDALRLEVRDDGRGYDGPRAGGLGVASMGDRAQQLGGHCEVVGAAEGTVVTAVLPVPVPAAGLVRAEAS